MMVPVGGDWVSCGERLPKVATAFAYDCVTTNVQDTKEQRRWKNDWQGAESGDGVLVIVPCGRSKIWDKNASAGPTPARDAYTGPLFAANRRYAEKFAERWVILSAKYGLVSPDVTIPGPYNVTFKRRSDGVVTPDELRQQVTALRLNEFRTVVGLGGKDYRVMIEAAFADAAAELRFPFAGLSIGKMLQAIKRAVESSDPHLEPGVTELPQGLAGDD